MAKKTFGTAHIYGIRAGTGAVTNATVVGFSLDKAHNLEDGTPNEDGQLIEELYDDVHQTGTITLRIRSGYSLPAPGTQITYDSVIYRVTSTGEAEQGQGYVEVTLGIKTTEYITMT